LRDMFVFRSSVLAEASLEPALSFGSSWCLDCSAGHGCLVKLDERLWRRWWWNFGITAERTRSRFLPVVATIGPVRWRRSIETIGVAIAIGVTVAMFAAVLMAILVAVLVAVLIAVTISITVGSNRAVVVFFPWCS